MNPVEKKTPNQLAHHKPHKQEKRNIHVDKERVPDFSTVKLPSPPPKIQYVDVGANLTDSRFRHDADQVIQRGFDQGVWPILITGTSEKESREAQLLSEKVPHVFCTVGVHPHVSKHCTESTISHLKELIVSKKNIVAVGETGLDFFRMLSPQDVQEFWFEQQLKLAVDVQLPVFLHDREGGQPFYRILSQYRPKLKGALVHCFTGTLEEASNYVALDCYIGVTGFICGPAGATVRSILEKKIIPLNRLVIETDAPYQAPKNAKPKINRNEPCYISYVCKTVAECFKITEEEAAKQTTENAIRFFNLPY